MTNEITASGEQYQREPDSETKSEAAYPLSIDKHSVNDAASWPLASSDHHHLWFFQQGAHKPGKRPQMGLHWH